MATSSNVINSAGRIDARDQAGVHVGDNHTHYHNGDPAEKRRQLRIQFLQGLRLSPYEERKDRNPKRAPGTCEWFTSHERFRAWQEQESALLWVSADPGCGKSVLSRYLVDDVLSTRADTVTCYFFFKDDFDDQRALTVALCCILHQLFTQVPQALSGSIITTYEHEGAFLFTSAKTLFRLLLEAASNCLRDVVCLFDALDECSDSKPLTDALRESRFNVNGRSTSKLKFIITSRPYQRIRDDFATLSTIHLSGENEQEVDQISHEIDIVVERRIQELATARRLSAKEEQSLRDALTRTSQRTYLWVHLVFVELEQARLLHGKAFLEVINTLPTSVEDAYSKILSKSGNAKQVLEVLQLVTAAARPLHLGEFAVALALVAGTHRTYSELVADVILDKDRLREELRDLCGFFIIIVEECLYLLHQTAREFLIRKESSIISKHNWQYCVELVVANAVLANISMRFLFLAPPPKPDDFLCMQACEDVAFMQYAASYWPEHYRQAESGSLTTEMLTKAIKLCVAADWWRRIYDHANNGETLEYKPRHGMVIAGCLGLTSVVRPLLEKYGEDNRMGEALIYASVRGHVGFVKYLLVRDVISDNGKSVPNSKQITQATGEALREAAHYGQYQVVELLLSHMPQGKARDKDKGLALFHASSADIVELLLRNGVSPHLKDSDGYSVLSKFAEKGDLDVVQALIRHGAQINGNSSRPALGSAASGGHVEMMTFLISRGAEIEARDNNGDTALMRAAALGRKDAVEFLMCQGAQVDARGQRGRTAMLLAAKGAELESPETVGLLLDYGAQIETADDKGRTALFQAAAAKPWRGEIHSLAVLELLMDRGAQIEARDKRGMTPLMAAAEACSPNAVRFLLGKGAQIEAKDRHGHTARFHIARKPSPLRSTGDLIRDREALDKTFDEAGLAKPNPIERRMSRLRDWLRS